MKGSERHRLKENELSHVLSDASARLQENRGTVGLAAGIVALVLVAGIGYWAWTTRSENRAQALLGDAIVIMQAPVEEPKPGAKPGARVIRRCRRARRPALAKFAEVYNAYPSTDAGIASRYYAASALSMLGRHAEAAARFQETVDRAGQNSFYGRMAQTRRRRGQRAGEEVRRSHQRGAGARQQHERRHHSARRAADRTGPRAGRGRQEGRSQADARQSDCRFPRFALHRRGEADVGRADVADLQEIRAQDVALALKIS